MHTPDDLPNADRNVMGTYSNIEHMMQSSPDNIQSAARVWVSSCLWAVPYYALIIVLVYMLPIIYNLQYTATHKTA